MQITVNDKLGKRIKSLSNPDEFVNSTLEKALLEQEKIKKRLKKAAHELLDDYKNNTELTEFTVLDREDFHA